MFSRRFPGRIFILQTCLANMFHDDVYFLTTAFFQLSRGPNSCNKTFATTMNHTYLTVILHCQRENQTIEVDAWKLSCLASRNVSKQSFQITAPGAISRHGWKRWGGQQFGRGAESARVTFIWTLDPWNLDFGGVWIIFLTLECR